MRDWEPVAQKDIWTTLKGNAALIGAILALLGVLITGAFNTYIANKDQLAQRKLELDNAEKQRELEQEKAQNAALQTYLDQMGKMLLNEGLPNSEEDSNLRTLARARTLSMFEQVSPEGKNIALVFLNEAGLIKKDDQIISLDGADLNGANLRRARLINADLSGAFLYNADLRRANLADANLSEALLVNADLREAYLYSTDLSQAILLDANLNDAKLVTNEELVERVGISGSLAGTTMPDGQKYEDWLKDREGRKQNE